MERWMGWRSKDLVQNFLEKLRLKTYSRATFNRGGPLRQHGNWRLNDVGTVMKRNLLAIIIAPFAAEIEFKPTAMLEESVSHRALVIIG
eukprot:scaffold5055_cov91-Cylindrotheca_fusiformis.AAC.4